jgi:lysophospholipase L1-like esterase
VGTRNDDISLILAKAKKQGFLPDVSDNEVDVLQQEAQGLFDDDNVLVTAKRTTRALRHTGLSILPGPPTATRPAYFERFFTDAGRCTRLRHVATSEITDLSLVYGNYGSADAEPNSAIKVRASVEYPTGSYYSAHFTGEDTNRDVTIAPGAFVNTQPVAIRIPKGAIFYTNTLVVPVTVGGQYPGGGLIVSTTSTTEKCSVGTTDYTLATNPGTGSDQFAYGPVAICGISSEKVTVYSLLGDSISVGTGDSQINSTYENGFLVRALNYKYPYLHGGANGEAAYNWDEADNTDIKRHRYRSLLVGQADVVIQEHCTNDFGNANRTYTQLQLSLISSWTQFALRGAKVYQTTCTPRTTSTDSWATLGNQTPVNARFGPEAGAGSDRQIFNTWLRDGAPILNGAPVATASYADGTVRAGSKNHPLTGVIDSASVVETYNVSTNNWVWKVASTTDGIHPNAASHALMATVVQTTLNL